MNPPLDLRPPDDASPLRQRTYEVIFGQETPWGRAFDVVLILAILASVLAIMLESVDSILPEHRGVLRTIEWGFTLAFTLEYLLRLWCVGRPRAYARSFFGVIDLFAVIPTYLSVLLPGGQVLIVVRVLRVLRVFRILKLVQYVGEGRILVEALRSSRFKITVFVLAVLSITVIVGSIMYLIEGPDAGFTSIPVGVYWAIVTLTTVGFGDITPLTPVGQTLAALVMVTGYGIIAVPTGIVTAELVHASRSLAGQRLCPRCGRPGHDPDATHCKWCGTELSGTSSPGSRAPDSEAGIGSDRGR